MVATLAIFGITAAEGATSGYAAPQWGQCPPSAYPEYPQLGQECANVSVPLNYSEPGGRRIDIAVSRLSTATPEKRRGVLLLVPSGPGNASLDMPTRFAQFMPQSVLERYDLIGFDPRGNGRSAPLTCGLSLSQLPVERVIPWLDPRGFEENVDFARFVARSCGSASTSDLLPFITTENRARDMDRIRVALGEDKISYVGYSYGTYLGAVYMSLFPHRSDRFVLDSVVSPRAIWRDTYRRMGPAVEVRFPDFARFAAERNDVYGLGATADEVRAKYFDLGVRLDATPVTLPTGLVVNGNFFREATRVTLYSETMFAGLADLWRLLDRAEATPPAAPAAAPEPAPAAAPGPNFPDVPEDNLVAGGFGLLCADAQWPTDPEQYRRDVRRDSRLFPVAGRMAANIFPCAFWPVELRKPLVEIAGDAQSDVLLIQSLRDIATPMLGALEMRAALGRRVRMVVSGGGSHSLAWSYNTDACIDGAANAFLADGVLHDTFCPREPTAPGVQAFDVGTSGRHAATQEPMRRMGMLGPWG